jgi:hypothetical protein
LKGKYYEEYMAQYKKGAAGPSDGIMNSTVYIKSQTLWRTLNLENLGGAGQIIRIEEQRIPKAS